MESLHYLLMKTHSMLSRGILSEAAKIGLTPGQPKILEFLLAKTEADQKTIAAYCEIEPATVGSILLRMGGCWVGCPPAACGATGAHSMYL